MKHSFFGLAPIGEKIELELIREGKRRTLTAEVAKIQEDSARLKELSADLPNEP